MEHLEFHPHAFVDKNNVVINIAIFKESDHDSQLLNSILQATENAVQVVCCCAFGTTAIGSFWDGLQFIPVSPYPSWIWNNINKIWEAPILLPEDGPMYKWDEPTVSWVIINEN
jgi:hypothetical protein